MRTTQDCVRERAVACSGCMRSSPRRRRSWWRKRMENLVLLSGAAFNTQASGIGAQITCTAVHDAFPKSTDTGCALQLTLIRTRSTRAPWSECIRIVAYSPYSHRHASRILACCLWSKKCTVCDSRYHSSDRGLIRSIIASDTRSPRPAVEHIAWPCLGRLSA